MPEPLPLDIQSGFVALSGPTGRQEVKFDRAFHSTPKITVSVSKFDIDQEPNGDIFAKVTAVDISTKGFWVELEGNGRVRVITAAWLAHSQ